MRSVFFLRYAGLPLLGSLPLQNTGSGRTGSAAMAHGPSRSAARGNLADRGANPRPLNRQADSQPLRHQGRPKFKNERILRATGGHLIPLYAALCVKPANSPDGECLCLKR